MCRVAEASDRCLVRSLWVYRFRCRRAAPSPCVRTPARLAATAQPVRQSSQPFGPEAHDGCLSVRLRSPQAGRAGLGDPSRTVRPRAWTSTHCSDSGGPAAPRPWREGLVRPAPRMLCRDGQGDPRRPPAPGGRNRSSPLQENGLRLIRRPETCGGEADCPKWGRLSKMCTMINTVYIRGYGDFGASGEPQDWTLLTQSI